MSRNYFYVAYHCYVFIRLLPVFNNRDIFSFHFQLDFRFDGLLNLTPFCKRIIYSFNFNNKFLGALPFWIKDMIKTAEISHNSGAWLRIKKKKDCSSCKILFSVSVYILAWKKAKDAKLMWKKLDLQKFSVKKANLANLDPKSHKL